MSHEMAALSPSCIKLVFIIVMHLESVLTTCMEHDNQIQGYLISTEPPYDNYYNISKAVYPSVDRPSLLIDITVTFLSTTDNSSSTLSNVNGSTASTNNSKQNGSDSYSYMWSMSCLYVSGGISLSSMNIFSLWAIWPNRRARKLYITLPQFCSGSPSNPHQHDTMIYFLSTLQDTAVARSLHDPQINTAECVIAGHEKASHFSGLKQLLHGVCWSWLFVSLVMSMFVSQWIIMQLRKWNAEQKWSKIVAVMFFSLFVFVVGLAINICAWALSTVQQDLYVGVFFGFVLLVFLRRAAWCMFMHRNKNVKGCLRKCSTCLSNFYWNITSGHGEETSKNFVSCFFLYPAVFMACHHLLWISLGIITEPFWGITILVGVISTSAAFCFLVCEFHKAYLSQSSPTAPSHLASSSPKNHVSKKSLKFMIFMSAILFLSAFIAFVLLLVVYFVVAQAFLSESLISAIVQNGLVTVVSLWLGYMKLGARGGGGGGAAGGGGKGAGAGGGRGGAAVGGEGDGAAVEGGREGETAAGEGSGRGWRGKRGRGGESMKAERKEAVKDQEHILLMSRNGNS